MSNSNLEQMMGLKAEFVPDEIQQQAIDACCDVNRRIVAITGKAGTGKTSIIKMVERQLVNAGYVVGASAPTGKAAKRIQETTGISAMTNHRMLGYGMPIDLEETDAVTGDTKVVKVSTGPKFKRSNPLPYDVILADEYAMVNREIHGNIVAALKSGARVCMFGDVNQLKPIEEGFDRNDNVESAFMASLRKFEGIALQTNHRQVAGSGIHINAERILQGKLPTKYDDFDIIYTQEPVEVVQKHVKDMAEQEIHFNTTDAQFITCQNKSWVGTIKLNLTVQQLYWDRTRPMLSLPRHRWISQQAKAENSEIRIQVGSKVVYTSNTYDLGNGQSVFNGEIGIVVEINHDEGSFDIDLGDRVITIPPSLITLKDNGTVIETDPRKNVDLAYVLTTHKMQGSECPHVTYVLNNSTTFSQSRRNFYTAITRASKSCAVITDMKSITKSTKWAG